MATQLPMVFTQGNSQLIQLYNLQDALTLQFWNSASATANLVDQNGNPTVVQDVPLAYQSGTSGNYVGSVTTDFISMPIGSGYTLLIDAEQGGARLHLELPAKVIARTS